MIAKEANSNLAAALAALADGIIPPDAVDAGAGAVDAGPRLAERVEQGVNRAVYEQGVATAEQIAREKFGVAVAQLLPPQIDELLSLLRDRATGFFKQLRMDVSALYLSDPGVWQRIGFPGPSSESGGHPDFDQPQTREPGQINRT